MKKAGGSCKPDVLDSNYGVERFEFSTGHSDINVERFAE